MKSSKLETEWKGRERGESDERGNQGYGGFGGMQGPPAVQPSAKAAVKRGPVFFPRPARRETLP